MELMGMVLEELNEENSRKFGIDLKRGVLIVKVEPGSPAAKSGLIPGMIVQEVERQTIDNLLIFKKIVNEIDTDRGILVLISTKNGSRYIFLQSD